MFNKSQLILYLLALVLVSRIDSVGILSTYSMSNCSKEVKLSKEKCNSTSCTSPWHFCDNGTCTCGPIPHDALQCDDSKPLPVSTYRCVTFDQASYSTYAGHCMYAYGRNDSGTLPCASWELEEVMCRKHFNRTGTLCGKCKDYHYPLAYSFDMNCVECPNGKLNWWKYVIAVFLPLTIFYLVVVVFKINVTSSRLQGFVFYCQGLTTPPLARTMLAGTLEKIKIHTPFRYIGFIWNLDILCFLKLDICLGTDTLQTLSLDLAVGAYPLLLMMLSYLLIRLYDSNFKPLVIIWKPFRGIFGLFKRNWEIRTSLIDAFATFFLLSYVKFLNVSFDLLAPVVVYQLSSSGKLTYSWRLYYDATVPYFGETHLPYAILAITVLTLFVILPTLLLILYPFRFFQRFLNLFPFRWYILHTFMDTFQGCYKDGTEPGTRDCRWFASVPFLVHFTAMAIGLLTFDASFLPLFSILLVLFAALLITVQPFKSGSTDYSSTNAMFVLLLALWYVSLCGYQVSQFRHETMRMPFLIIGGFTTVITLLYIMTIILQWMYSQRIFGMAIIRRISAWRHGYEPLQH